MADWDSADLLARVKELTQRPLVDQSIDDPGWYKHLAKAQRYWLNMLAIHCPWVAYTAPTKLATADGGKTYTFPNNVTPLKAELYDAPGGRKLIPCAYWSTAGDYVWEGARIRMPLDSTRTFSDGPYARYIIPGGALDGGNPPTLIPDYARELIVPRAAIIWARRGGLRNPQSYIDEENDLWYGDPQRGKIGMLGMFKNQNPDLGATAIRRESSISGLGYLTWPGRF